MVTSSHLEESVSPLYLRADDTVQNRLSEGFYVANKIYNRSSQEEMI